MLYLKNNPVGIDKTINDINETVYNSLGWTPENNISYNAYSRALKNPRNGGIVPEVYKVEDVTTGIPFGEYSEVLYDDNVNASSFFYVDDNVSAVDNGRLFTTTISMVFQLDLSVVANNILHRGDEEINTLLREIYEQAGKDNYKNWRFELDKDIEEVKKEGRLPAGMSKEQLAIWSADSINIRTFRSE